MAEVLINGVFEGTKRARIERRLQAMKLIQNVAATTEGLMRCDVLPARAPWLAERFPVVVRHPPISRQVDKPRSAMTADERAEAQAERDASTRLRLVRVPPSAVVHGTFGGVAGRSPRGVRRHRFLSTRADLGRAPAGG